MRLNVLVSAYACSPYHGSEPGVGWGWVNAIAQHHNVWVITDAIHKADIEKTIAEDPERYKNVRFFYIPRTRWLILEKIWPPAYQSTYSLWEREAYKLGRDLHEKINFDLVHRITFVSFRKPGFLWRLDIPFVWGPIGGLENTPWRFLPMMGAYGCLYFLCRNIINFFQKMFLTGPKRAFKKASGNIIAATEGIRKEILRWYGEDSSVICEIGPPAVIESNYSKRAEGEVLRISWSGHYLPGKALPLLLKALALLPEEIKWTLDILGHGPCAGKWKKLAERLGLAEHCQWHGWVARNEAVRIIHESHIFVITSLKDLTSTVLLEALSQGVPVICPDHCGFSNVVTAECGIKVPIVSPAQFVADLCKAIKQLAEDEKRRCELAVGALRRITDFSWGEKAQIVDEIYRNALKKTIY